MDTTTIIVSAIGVVGSIASIYGAYLSIQAKKEAKNSADIAEQAKTSAENARDQVIHKQQTTSLVTVLNESKRVQKVFFKYSRAQNTRSFDGADFDKDAIEFQSIITIFNESRGIIEEETDLEANTVYNELNDLLNNFTTSTAKNDKKIYGHQIRLKLDDIIHKFFCHF
jgi:hypothetical protein